MKDLTSSTAGMAAGILESSASGYAAAASAALQRRSAKLGLPAGDAFAVDRKAYFVQRILELAAALRVSAPALFARRVAWLRSALIARGADEADLHHALLSLKDALEQELPRRLIATALEPIDEALELLRSPPAREASALDPADPEGRLALRYLEACLAAEPERAHEIALNAVDELTPARLYTQVLAPAEREIGRLWHTGEVSIAEERLVTETTRQLLAIVAHRYKPSARLDRTVIAASVAGNIHDIGLRIVTELFRLAGWRCIFLGATMPAEQLARAAASFNADLVILTATLATQLSDTAQAIAAIRQSSKTVKVLVGGAAFEDAPGAWRDVGADGFSATLDDAVAAGDALVVH